MKARELIEKIMKLDNLNTEIDFRKFFSDGEDKDLLLDFCHIFYPDAEDKDNDRFIIGFKERKNEWRL